MKRSERLRIIADVVALEGDLRRYHLEDRAALILCALLKVQRRTDPHAQTELGRWIQVLDDMAMFGADNNRPYGVRLIDEAKR